MKKAFTPFSLKNLSLKNRIVMPPMCMYSAASDGIITPWHITHYAARALGGVGLIIVEATGVSPEGRITDEDLGLWSDDHIKGLKQLTEAVHLHGSQIGIQLGHAGRKSESAVIPHYAPSAISFNDEYITPEAMNEEALRTVREAFREAARRANEAGFDMIELHAAHGYLLSEFLSPLANQRDDAYGKTPERFLLEVIDEVKKVWPEDKVLAIRVSATDWREDGMTVPRMTEIVKLAKAHGVDLINVSTGGVVETPIKAYPGYQVAASEIIRKEADIPTMAGGLINAFDMVTDILESDKADLVFLGRELLRNPFWVHQQARSFDLKEAFVPKAYWRA